LRLILNSAPGPGARICYVRPETRSGRAIGARPAPAPAGARDPAGRGGALIAQEEYPELDVHAPGAAHRARPPARARLATYSQTEGTGPAARGRARSGCALRNFLYGEHGFHGPRDDEFFDPRNSLLNDVLDRHTGLPITLALVFIEVGRAIGLDLAGVNFPGHFLVKTVYDGPELLLDPFNRGREVTWVEAIDRIEKVNGKKEPPEDYTEAVTPRRFLFRLLSNLKAAYLREEKFDEAIAVIDRLLMVHPAAHWERRDRGLLLLKTGSYHRARVELEGYLAAVPGADDRESVERRIEQARQLAMQLN
jgi:regulator of sirC expression with transglutaminase-like and TPR domain